MPFHPFTILSLPNDHIHFKVSVETLTDRKMLTRPNRILSAHPNHISTVPHILKGVEVGEKRQSKRGKEREREV